jgi:hypothetical protein
MTSCCFFRLHQFKAWFRFSKELPVWPIVVYARYTIPGTAGGHEGDVHQKDVMNRIFVKPSGPLKACMKPYHHGVWMACKNIKGSFLEKRDAHLAEGLAFKRADVRDYFAECVQALEDDGEAVDFPFEFAGCLEIRYFYLSYLTATRTTTI